MLIKWCFFWKQDIYVVQKYRFISPHICLHQATTRPLWLGTMRMISFASYFWWQRKANGFARVNYLQRSVNRYKLQWAWVTAVLKQKDPCMLNTRGDDAEGIKWCWNLTEVLSTPRTSERDSLELGFLGEKRSREQGRRATEVQWLKQRGLRVFIFEHHDH